MLDFNLNGLALTGKGDPSTFFFFFFLLSLIAFVFNQIVLDVSCDRGYESSDATF